MPVLQWIPVEEFELWQDYSSEEESDEDETWVYESGAARTRGERILEWGGELNGGKGSRDCLRVGLIGDDEYDDEGEFGVRSGGESEASGEERDGEEHQRHAGAGEERSGEKTYVGGSTGRVRYARVEDLPPCPRFQPFEHPEPRHHSVLTAPICLRSPPVSGAIGASVEAVTPVIHSRNRRWIGG